MSNNVIEVKNVGKMFRLKDGGTRTFKSAALGWLRGGSRHDFWALKDVSFSVPKGETLGIIGTNGAGKSTLLSLLAGTMQPTEGTVVSKGSMSSLLELGAGFHPDLTGRENVFLYGAIMGIPRAQMQKRFDAVVDFAGLAEFIDQPVKRYSSGMYIRLGFAVAVEVDPEILLIDEVLAVGDVAFQKKCMDKMHDFKAQGKTMLIVSHDLGTIQKMSDRIMLLNNGQVLSIGDPGDIVTSYRTSSGQKNADSLKKEWGTGDVKVSGVEFLDGAGETVEDFTAGGELVVRISYKAEKRIENPVFGFSISDDAGTILHGSNTQIAGTTVSVVEGEGSITLYLDKLFLSAGSYLFSFAIHSDDHKTNYHRIDNAFPIACRNDSTAVGPCSFPSRWERV
ncbi:MAG: ABC transporter ATP-binding protein [Kiritimatiellae bacterium]|nr:ABC transporter ATP-binding protein [Kiritimatiellia bacterium]